MTLQNTENLTTKIQNFPKTSGVYLMKDCHGVVIYVGKAKVLKERVKQYFNQHDKRYHVKFLMQRVTDIDFLETHSEREALLLENSLIKKHKPKYNLCLKDDKTYLGLKITLQDDFPKLIETRKIKKDGSLYYGPFIDSYGLRDVKEFIYRYFQLRTCKDSDFNSRTRACLEYDMKRCSGPCVGYVSQNAYRQQIEQVRLFLDGKNSYLQNMIKKNMFACAEQEKFEDAARLRDLLKKMDAVLEKQNVTALSFDFVDVLAMMRFDHKIGIGILMVREAQLIHSDYIITESVEEEGDFLQNFLCQYYSERSFIPKEILLPLDLNEKEMLAELLTERAGYKVSLRLPKKGEKKDLLNLAFQNLQSHFVKQEKKQHDRQSVLEALQKSLNLNTLPKRIECYDISNISGKFPVASMVVFIDGLPAKKLYKKFHIKTLDTPNDFAMMFEVLSRRFKHSEKDWQYPDILLIDGGKGQMTQAIKVLEDLQINQVNIVSIAKGRGEGARAKGLWDNKKEEEIYLPGRKNPIIFRRGSAELMLLQNVRDESHRFAIEFHRKTREKSLTTSWLDEVEGIGPHLKKALLKKFGSLAHIKQASLQELTEINGITLKIAQEIKKDYLKDSQEIL